MKKYLLILGLSISALFLLPACAEVATGSKAPTFSLPNLDGSTTSLKDYSGKTVVLEWFNEGCPFVKKHYSSGNMQQLQKEFTAEGVVWLTIVSSAPGKQGHGSAADHTATRKKWETFETALLIDEDGSVGKKYGAKTTPHMFIINTEGTLVYQGAIDSIRSTEASDIPKATPYVKNALEALAQESTIEEAQTVPYGCAVKY